MRLTFTVDTEDMFNYEGEHIVDFEDLFAKALSSAAVQKAKDDIKTDKFKEYSNLVGDKILADVKMLMNDFLSEEIVLADRWGEKTFVGSIEDLIKQRFDDVLLRPVNSSGETLEGCSASSKQTRWIEWKIDDTLKSSLSSAINAAERRISDTASKLIKKELEQYTNGVIKDKVTETFQSLLQAGNKSR